MRIHRKDEPRQRPVRHGLVVAILLLLPFLTVVGVLAPGLVTIQYEEEEGFAPRREREPHPALQLAHRALLTAHDYTNRAIPMVDLEKLFVKPRYRVRRESRGVPLPRFPQTRGDVIALDDIDGQIADTPFEDALQPGVVADATATWDPNLFDVIPNTTFPGRGTVHYDDFMGDEEEEDAPPAPVVPEPGTAALLALGLVGLALRARQRQPATS